MEMRCGHCYQAFHLPANPQKTVPCPHCRYAVLVVDEENKTSYFSPQVRAAWKQPCGIILFWLGIAAFLGSFYVGYNSSRNIDDGIVTGAIYGLLNPLTWIGWFSGIIWGNIWSTPGKPAPQNQ